ncbi:MAG: hypothetical protein ACKOUR_11860, partial [Planctomycetota bacterium]
MNRFSVCQRRALSWIVRLRLGLELPIARFVMVSLLVPLSLLVMLPTVVAQEPAPALTYLTGHQQGVYAVGYSPDGKTMISVGLDGTVRY